MNRNAATTGAPSHVARWVPSFCQRSGEACFCEQKHGTGTPVRVRRGTCSARPAHGERAAALMEVVFALSLLTAAAGTILGAFDASIRSLERLRLEAQASDLAVTLLSRLRMGDLPAINDGPNQYGQPLEDWTWQTAAEDMPEPIDGARMKKIRIVITNTVEDYTYELAYLLADDEREQGRSGGSPGPGPEGFGELP